MNCWSWRCCRQIFQKCKLILLIVAIIFVYKIFLVTSDCQQNVSNATDAIDVVYTWVNGSDPSFIAQVQQYDNNYDPTRYDEKNELLYSLRSLEKYANWVRHIYIVTNGQIPDWLDINNERITVVPHKHIAAIPASLPTFSSPAIETFIHRIPNLSKRFLYMNDDIFLGQQLYPDDLYTESSGTLIAFAWPVPDCALDCPWEYIGDGSCDRHCNIAQCQYDGNDCKNLPKAQAQAQQRTVTAPAISTPTATHRSVSRKTRRDLPNFRDYIRTRNFSSHTERYRLVKVYNNEKVQSQFKLKPVEFATTAGSSSLRYIRKSSDIYRKSLIYTNMLLNNAYGFRTRSVPAHTGLLLDRDIISAMQLKFPQEIRATALHRFRSPLDLQLAFVYYNFLTAERRNLSVQDIFDTYDTDGSHTWSDREIRTLLTRFFGLPLDWALMDFFEEVVTNCSLQHKVNAAESTYTTIIYERYEGSNLPRITRDLVSNCQTFAEALMNVFSVKPMYKAKRRDDVSKFSDFFMLTSNLTEVINGLDKLRQTPKTFICINDDMDPKRIDDNRLVRNMLQDFYLSFFPRRSQFELPANYRNRFSNYDDYHRWRRRNRAFLFCGYALCALLLLFLIYFYIEKRKQTKRRLRRYIA